MLHKLHARITFAPAKRARTLAEWGPDFADAGAMLAGATVEFEDDRQDYGEQRMICFGYLHGPAGDDRLCPDLAP